MNDFILVYDPIGERGYALYSEAHGLKILLDNDLTPMDPDYYEQILAPAIVRMQQEIMELRNIKN